jgi:D-proline reductase (dithiol) PrdB
VGLVARVFEREGIAAVTLTSALDVTERVRPPRSAFLNFPLGNQAGPPGQPDLQREIVRRALNLLESAKEPGEIIRLPFEWPDPDWQSQVIATYKDEAAIVGRQRVESETDESGNFAVQECIDVCSLV